MPTALLPIYLSSPKKLTKLGLKWFAMKFLPFLFFLVSVSSALQGQERQPNWGIRFSPTHLAYMDPTIQFQWEKFSTPQQSWTSSLGIGHESIFKNRDIQYALQVKFGAKRYFQPFSLEKKNNFYVGLEGMYRYSIERQQGFIRFNEDQNIQYKLGINAMAGHVMLGWTLFHPEAPTIDIYVGAGIRHIRSKNIGIDPTLVWEQPLTQFNRSAGNSTALSPLLGICIGIGRWK